MSESELLKRRLDRERKARKAAETLLEQKSLELFHMNEDLVELAANLAEKEEHSRSILQAANDGIVTTNDEGKIISINNAIRIMTGYQPEELENQPIGKLLPDCTICEGLKQHAESPAEQKLSFFHETLGGRKNGETFPVELTISVAHPGQRNIYIFILRDISARMQAEADLAKANRQMQLILETVGEGIFGVDADGYFTFVNQAASKILNWPAAEMIGQQSHQLIHHSFSDGNPHTAEQCPIYSTLHEGDAHTISEDVFWRKDGLPVPVEYFSKPIRENHAIVGAVVTFLDISERKQAEEQQKKLEIQLRQTQKLEAIGELAAGIAHEINTPTQYVADNTRFLQDSCHDFSRFVQVQRQALDAANSAQADFDKAYLEVNEVAEEIEIDYLLEEVPLAIKQSLEGLQRITRIVQAMKEFSHPGVEEKTIVDLNASILSTIDVSTNAWKYDAEMVTDLEPDLPQVRCLPGELNQAILNIIVNAAHAISENADGRDGAKGLIMISTQSEGNEVEVRITDNGGGIPEEIRSRIFDPFFTTKDVGKGTGQGLAIAYSAIVDKHGGEIEVESRSDVGTTFIIRLPIDGSEPPQGMA